MANRRKFLQNLGILSLASSAAGIGLELSPRLAYADARDYTTKETFDWMTDALTGLNRPPHNESGGWSWHWAQVMLSYLPMYLAYGDTSYLDKLIAEADVALATRDTERGVSDYLGRSLPWWRTGNHYMTGAVRVPATDGSPLLKMQIGLKGNATGAAGTVNIRTGSAPDLYTITSVDFTGNKVDEFVNVSLDPHSADYVVPRLYWSAPNITKTTAVDLRPSPNAPSSLQLGTYNYRSEYMPSLVDTGVIMTPLAWFAAIIKNSPRLRRSYDTKANEYIAAVESALAGHESEWRQNTSGEGWYAIDPGAPSVASGADWPHNQNLAVAHAYTHLATATRNVAHRTRARQLLQRFKNDLAVQGNSYVWNYWCSSDLGYIGWNRADHVSDRIPYWGPYHSAEDTSHAYIDVIAATEGHFNGLVFTGADMAKFAATYTDNLLTTDADGNPAVRGNVYGTGNAVESYNTRTGVWSVFAEWDPDILPHLVQILNHEQYLGSPNYQLMSVAYVVAASAP